MSEVVRLRPQAEDSRQKKSAVPVTCLWNNARMVRTHSIKAVANEIINLVTSLDVVKINIVGSPSTGKSTLAETLAHLIHSQAKMPFAVRILTREDLKEFENTLSKLDASTNWILVFDDISFMKAEMSASQLHNLEKGFTQIRHLPGGQDVKIVAIFNFHYTMAVSKYLRQSEFLFDTSVGISDIDNLIKSIGAKFTQRIYDF